MGVQRWNGLFKVISAYNGLDNLSQTRVLPLLKEERRFWSPWTIALDLPGIPGSGLEIISSKAAEISHAPHCQQAGLLRASLTFMAHSHPQFLAGPKKKFFSCIILLQESSCLFFFSFDLGDFLWLHNTGHVSGPGGGGGFSPRKVRIECAAEKGQRLCGELICSMWELQRPRTVLGLFS